MKSFGTKVVLRVLSVLLVSFTIIQIALSSGEIRFVPVKETSKAVVSLKDVDGSQAILSIEDQSQNYVYFQTKVYNVHSYKKLMDLSNLEDGLYYLIARTKEGTIKRAFTLENSKIRLENTEVVFPPRIKDDDEYMTLVFESPESSNIKVTFSENNQVFFSDHSDNNEILRKYDLRKLPRGSYEVTLTAGNYYYTYELDIAK